MTEINFQSFQAKATTYSGNNAYLLATAAKLAYDRPENVEKSVKKDWQMPNVRFIDKNETQGFVAGDDEKIIVSFRGTEPNKIKDWMTDLRVRFADHSLGKVHRGFLQALDHAWGDTIKTVKEFQTKDQTIWFTGHSLGAALATLGVAKMYDLNQTVHGLYTFGQPRTGDGNFAKQFDANYKLCCFRFVNNNDLVTRFPFSAIGYKHIGTFLYLDTSQNLHNSIHWWSQFKDGVKGSLEDLGKPNLDGIKDHDMELYIQGIKKNLDKKIVP